MSEWVGVIGSLGGVLIGLGGNFVLKKIEFKYEIQKEEKKLFIKEQIKIYQQLLLIKNEFEKSLNQTFDLVYDDDNIPTRTRKTSEIKAIYFKKFYEYIELNQFYIMNDLLEIFDKMNQPYYEYSSDMDIVSFGSDDIEDAEKIWDDFEITTKKIFALLLQKINDNVRYLKTHHLTFDQ